jgi:hypothetical protein
MRLVSPISLRTRANAWHSSANPGPSGIKRVAVGMGGECEAVRDPTAIRCEQRMELAQ